MSYGVLLIEDEELLSKNIRLYLQRYGHEVQVAASSRRRLELEVRRALTDRDRADRAVRHGQHFGGATSDSFSSSSIWSRR